ncbi:F-box/kelch-repeat protein At3g06240-like [Mercurialis annua]|uniref:F-box/kelch-repeat protein At3g06240-like n=2 Tax=Mercurialis annua TaxID=3986 RepID=UPI0024AE5498|nr:F-box/kelch-repeat protein At3g06240-like [Mercurialis annua]
MLHSNRSIYPYSVSKLQCQYSMHFDNKDFDQLLSVRPLFNQAEVYTNEVVGSSNGLVCLFCVYENNNQFKSVIKYSQYIDKLVIWNPFIRKSFMIPERPCCSPPLGSSDSKLIGFGFDSRLNDYKLLVAHYLISSIKGVVLYSLNSNSWKKITNATPSCRYYIDFFYSSAFVVDGRFYWPMLNKNLRKMLLVFDLRDEMFGEISLPAYLENDRSTNLTIKTFGESSIAVIVRNGFYEYDIWVMKEYETREWMKLARVGKRWREFSNLLEFRDNG